MSIKFYQPLARLLVFGFIIYASMNSLGVLLMERTVEPQINFFEIQKIANKSIDTRWAEAIHLMKTTPSHKCHLAAKEMERAKEIVLIALTAHPEEWEGSGLVPASLGTIEYLMLIYPDLAQFVVPNEDMIKLEAVHEYISSHSVPYWRIPFIELTRRMRIEPRANQ